MMQSTISNRQPPESQMLGKAMLFLGFSLPFPGLLVPGAMSSPRYTDLAVIICLFLTWKTYNAQRAQQRNTAFMLVWQAAVIVPAVVHYLIFGGFAVADYVYYGRWIAAIGLAAPLSQIMPGNPKLQRLFLFGIITGSALHAITIWFSAIGGKSILLAIGFASPRVVSNSYNGETRITSLSEHANLAMILIAMAVPAAVSYRLVAPRHKGLWLVGASLIILIIGFFFTLSRSATLASGIALLAGGIQFFKRSDKGSFLFRMTFLTLAVIIIVLGIYLSTVEIGQDRLAERIASKGLEKNLDGRLHTVEATIALLGDYPLGTGWSQFLKRITLADGLTASHNGYLFTARIMGIPLLLLIAIGHFRVLMRIASTRRIDALPPLMCFLLVIMFAEDVTQGMSLVFFVTFMAMCGYKYEPWASTIYSSALVPTNRASRGIAGNIMITGQSKRPWLR